MLLLVAVLGQLLGTEAPAWCLVTYTFLQVFVRLCCVDSQGAFVNAVAVKHCERRCL